MDTTGKAVDSATWSWTDPTTWAVRANELAPGAGKWVVLAAVVLLVWLLMRKR